MKSILILAILAIPLFAFGYEPEGFISTDLQSVIKFPSAVFIGTDTPDPCIDEIKFAVYGDESLSKLCYCTGELWCPVDGGACGSSTSCD